VFTVTSNRPSLYHKDVYAPAVLFRSPGVLRVRYSYHAQEAARDDRYGDLSRYLTPYRDFDDAEIVEVELDRDGQIAKRLARFNITDELVLVMAVNADGYVKTVWCNRYADRHATLDRRKYVQRPRLPQPEAA
jgi:hypothetical protein